MYQVQKKSYFAKAVAICLLTAVQSQFANAHFLYATSAKHDGKGEARLYFSEAANVAAERMPERIAASDVWCVAADGKITRLSPQLSERLDQPQLVAEIPTNAACSIESTCRYGVYQTFLLTYYAKHLRFSDSSELKGLSASKKLALDVVPKKTKDGLRLTVLWKNQPLPKAELLLTSIDDDELKATTNSEGVYDWKCAHPGTYAVRVHHVEKGITGELDGKKYSNGHHYSTLTFNLNQSAANTDFLESNLPTLPEAISSFGAVTSDGWLYVYSGHTGKAHDHSKDNLSPHFRRVSLAGGHWEELPCQTPVQGLALVAHDRYVYRVGGMTARNSLDEDADLHSLSDFARFDPSTKQWQALPKLPVGRSSHDAVVIGGKIYVAGGWYLNGSDEGEWQSSVLVFDLTDSSANWESIDQPFVRRALATSHVGGDLFVLGGMNADHLIERTVNVFSPATGEWSTVADLPGEGMNGFGVSAWNANGKLFVSGSNGIVYRLSEGRNTWHEATTLATPRFFHQLVEAPGGDILAVGGASMSTGHLKTIELIRTTE